MCRNITELRGLEPPATYAEIEAASRQFVRKVSGLAKPSPSVSPQFEAAVTQISTIVEGLLMTLPERRQPPATVPPLRRPEVRRRLGMSPFQG
jgi:hypothetical protein